MNLEYSSVTLAMMLEKGLIEPNTRLYPLKNKDVQAIVKPNGKIEITIDSKVQQTNSLSGAAKIVTGLQLNGWKYWHVDINGELIEISNLRKKYFED